MKRALLIAAAAILATASATASAGSTATRTGSAQLHPLTSAGISGMATFVDNPEARTITIHMTATGLHPGSFNGLPSRYISLIYDGRASRGPSACLPVSEQLSHRMLIGAWTVEPNGTGHLDAVNLLDETKANPFASPRTYAPLTLIHTVSIRELPNFNLVACGEVKER